MTTADFQFNNHGSICILIPLTQEAQEWADENISADAMTFGGGTVIEPRYAGAVLEGIADAGLTVEA